MGIQFHDDWKHILRHAWSIRLIAVAAVLSGIEVSLPLIQPYVSVNPVWLASATGIATAAAFVARLVAQKEFENECPNGP